MTEPQAHLLVVDDDERIRGLLQKFLMRSGYLVTVARDAAQARRLLAGLEFDMIVLDVMMPGEDGISLTRELRSRLAVPILLLTATEAALMRQFAAQPGQPIPRERLVGDPGKAGEEGAQERAVDVQITRLRRKIEEDPRQPRYLQTVRGEGYMLQPD